MSPDYRGWVYLLKSSDKLTASAFYPDTLGVFYIPEKLFTDEAAVQFMVDDTLIENQFAHFYNHEFHGTSGEKTIYLSFYFPLTSFYKEQKLYSYEGRDLPEFQYFYYNGVIKRERLFR